MKTRALLGLGLAGLVLAGLFFYRSRAHEAAVGTLIDGRDDDGNRLTFRIDWSEPDPTDAEGEIHLYGLSVKVEDEWHPYCAPDRDGRRAAIPISGSYDVSASNMRVDTSSDTLTFACTSGAIGKCVRFGYKPWKEDTSNISLATLHAACVRMVRADYCGNGRAHTRDGTRVDVYDRRGIQKPDPDHAHQEELEAGWSPSGATYLSVPRWTDDVAEIVRECPDRLAHRTSLDEPLTAEQVTRRFPETVLFDNRMRNSSDRLMTPAVEAAR
jgi:hypothetical protein